MILFASMYQLYDVEMMNDVIQKKNDFIHIDSINRTMLAPSQH